MIGWWGWVEVGREERSRLLNFITGFCLLGNNNYTYVLQKLKLFHKNGEFVEGTFRMIKFTLQNFQNQPSPLKKCQFEAFHGVDSNCDVKIERLQLDRDFVKLLSAVIDRAQGWSLSPCI